MPHDDNEEPALDCPLCRRGHGRELLSKPENLLAAGGGDDVRPPKDFDCVQIKSDIQQQLMREIEELGGEEARRRQRERVMSNPILGPFLSTKMAREIIDKPGRKAS